RGVTDLEVAATTVPVVLARAGEVHEQDGARRRGHGCLLRSGGRGLGWLRVVGSAGGGGGGCGEQDGGPQHGAPVDRPARHEVIVGVVSSAARLARSASPSASGVPAGAL